MIFHAGVNGDTGAVMGAAFEADLTVTFGFLKAGLCLYPGRKNAGRTVLADIGVYGESGVFEKKRILEVEDTKKIPGRTPEGNKSTFGKVLAVAGSPGMCGAAYFCAAAAFAGGAGMVRILTDEVTVFLCRACFRKPLLIVEKERRPIRMPLTGVM